MSYHKNEITFLRFGNLKSIKQDGYKKEDSFHGAPARKGIYAFISFMIEPFLLGGYNEIGTKYSKYKYVRDSKGNKIITCRYYIDKNRPPVDKYSDYFDYNVSITDEHRAYLEKRYGAKQKNLFISDHYDEKTGFVYMITLKKPKRFKYTKEIWHHHVETTPRHLILKEKGDWILTDFNTFVLAFNKAIHNDMKYRHPYNFDIRSRYKQFSKDVYEVFIEKI